jgi:NAD+ dependent glucose-6-phosphate dehydrogenase
VAKRKTVLITGATGNLGSKLRRHFSEAGQHGLRLLGSNPDNDPSVLTADLSIYDDRWAQRFGDVDLVIRLAGDLNPRSSCASIQRYNVDLTLNVFQVIRRYGSTRLIFASSNWAMVGYRFSTEYRRACKPGQSIRMVIQNCSASGSDGASPKS